MAGLTELIGEIGDENVSVQRLDVCMESSNYKKGVTTVKFQTGALGPLDCVGQEKTALIVWVDVKDFNKALNKLNSQEK